MSTWLEWKKARWLGKPVPDYFIDEHGTFYCSHHCQDLQEHSSFHLKKGELKMAGTYTTTMDADGTKHVYAGLSAKETRQLLHHFATHALMKVIEVLPEADDTASTGTNTVNFSCVTTRDADGSRAGGQVNDWPNLSDTAAGALHGAFDAALARLDKHLAAKHKS